MMKDQNINGKNALVKIFQILTAHIPHITNCTQMTWIKQIPDDFYFEPDAGFSPTMFLKNELSLNQQIALRFNGNPKS